MSDASPSGTLVVVALDAAEREDAAIELASLLVPAKAPELLGLFIENAQLLEHASSSRAREILLTGAERALDRAMLERQLRVQATRARTRFETASARLGLRHRFEITRGDVVTAAIDRAATAGALVLNVTRIMDTAGIWPARVLGQIVEARLPRVLLARAGWQSGRSIVVLVDDIVSAETMLEAAARFAGQSGTPVTVLLTASKEASLTAVQARIADALRRHGIDKSDVIVLPESTSGAIVRLANAWRPRLLVAPSPAKPKELSLVEALLRRMPGALMLVRP